MVLKGGPKQPNTEEVATFIAERQYLALKICEGLDNDHLKKIVEQGGLKTLVPLLREVVKGAGE